MDRLAKGILHVLSDGNGRTRKEIGMELAKRGLFIQRRRLLSKLSGMRRTGMLDNSMPGSEIWKSNTEGCSNSL